MAKFMEQSSTSLKVNKEGFVSVGFVKLHTLEMCGLSLIPFLQIVICMKSSAITFSFSLKKVSVKNSN
jgi:hypothetical protein